MPPAQAADLECVDWLVGAQVPFALVFTKLDKRKKKCPRPEENIAAFQVRLPNPAALHQVPNVR